MRCTLLVVGAWLLVGTAQPADAQEGGGPVGIEKGERVGAQEEELGAEEGEPIRPRWEAGLQLDRFPLWGGSDDVRAIAARGISGHLGYAFHPRARLRAFAGHAPGELVDRYRSPRFAYYGLQLQLTLASFLDDRVELEVAGGNAAFTVGRGSGRTWQCRPEEGAICEGWSGPRAFEAGTRLLAVVEGGLRVDLTPNVALRVQRRHFFRDDPGGEMLTGGVTVGW